MSGGRDEGRGLRCGWRRERDIRGMEGVEKEVALSSRSYQALTPGGSGGGQWRADFNLRCPLITSTHTHAADQDTH